MKQSFRRRSADPTFRLGLFVDNVTLNAGSGGDVVATEDIGGVEYQKVKLIDGTATSTTALEGGGGTEATALRVTVASDSTGVLSVDDNGGSLTVDGTVTADAGTGPWPVTDNGGSLTVDGTVTANLGATDNAVLDTIATNTGASIPTGSNTIGEVTIGAATTAAGDLAKAEDAVHTSGDVGVMALGVRQDTQADFGADGDYVPLSIDADGAVRVNAINAGGTNNVDTASGATDSGAVMLAVRDDSLTTLTPVDGDYTTLRVNSTGALHVTGGGGGTEYTEDDAAPANPVGTASLMERDDALGGLTPIEGDWSHQFCNANGAMWVKHDGALAATQSGTWNVTNISGTVSLPTGASTAANQATQTTALQLIDNPIVAHDAAVSGSTGVNMAGFNARSSEPTAVASADATQGLATLLGKQVVVKGAIPASTWQYASVSGGITDTADDAAKAAAGAGIRNYITGVQVMNGHATVSTEVVIKDGTTVIWRGYAQAAGGGCSATFDPPLRGTANTAVNVANITTGSATRFNLQGYVAAE